MTNPDLLRRVARAIDPVAWDESVWSVWNLSLLDAQDRQNKSQIVARAAIDAYEEGQRERGYRWICVKPQNPGPFVIPVPKWKKEQCQ